MVLPSGFKDTVVPQREENQLDDMTPKARGNSGRMGLDFLQVNHQHFSDKVEAGNGPALHSVHDTEPKSVKVADRLGDKKILGVPIFEKACASNNHSSFQLTPAKINHYPSNLFKFILILIGFNPNLDLSKLILDWTGSNPKPVH
uniref:Uncharacterized protein n=1 Tax=Nelumbo nucifera TaxID=4432 RepID=A0A822Z217_NELNU|nr:TPA_asm: hypothetical protein HUJ06_013385 [Nelumbo nucifera]